MLLLSLKISVRDGPSEAETNQEPVSPYSHSSQVPHKGGRTDRHCGHAEVAFLAFAVAPSPQLLEKGGWSENTLKYQTWLIDE